jgi:hypothetical protein
MNVAPATMTPATRRMNGTERLAVVRYVVRAAINAPATVNASKTA